MNPFKSAWNWYRRKVNPLQDPPKLEQTERVRKQMENEGIHLKGEDARNFEKKIGDGLKQPVGLAATPKLEEAKRRIDQRCEDMPWYPGGMHNISHRFECDTTGMQSMIQADVSDSGRSARG